MQGEGASAQSGGSRWVRDGYIGRRGGSSAPLSAPQRDDQKTKAEQIEEEKKRWPDLDAVETKMIAEYFDANSEVYKEWHRVRDEGRVNCHISKFFENKKSGQSRGKRGGAHTGANIYNIFSQFYKYAVDIDNGVDYAARARDIAERTGRCTFLDFGFAPGGMADLLLESHPGIRGVGCTLPPSLGGNVYLNEMDRDAPPYDRFTSVLGDVIELARDDADLVGLTKGFLDPGTFEGFDFVIVGITIHQEWDGESMNELKDLLHFAQLYFTMKYLKPGGMVLMRMHMSGRLVDCHLLSFMLSHFDGRAFLAYSTALAGDADEGGSFSVGDTVVATKPFSTFSMRKTYWVLYRGFRCSEEERAACMGRLHALLEKDLFAYGYDEGKGAFNKPTLMTGELSAVLAQHGSNLIAVLEPVWAKQVIAIRGFMRGLTDKFCRRGPSCRRRDCNMAHAPGDMIPEVLSALRAVDARARDRLARLRDERWHG